MLIGITPLNNVWMRFYWKILIFFTITYLIYYNILSSSHIMLSLKSNDAKKISLNRFHYIAINIYVLRKYKNNNSDYVKLIF